MTHTASPSLAAGLALGFSVGALALLVAVPPAQALQCSAGTFSFYPGGGIKSCRIDADHNFWTARGEALKCKSGYDVTQYPNGAVESCTTAEIHTFGTTQCPPGRVELNPDGTLRKCG